jgi:hypothetical protein
MFATDQELSEISVPENEETSEEYTQEVEQTVPEIEEMSAETAQEFDQLVPETVLSELLEPRWSVITFESCAVRGLNYDEATTWLGKLKNQGLSGLCIVTDEAADRISD